MASATSYSTGYATAASSSSMSATYAGSSSSLSTCVAEAPQANITKIVKARVIRYVIEYPESHQLVRKHRSDLMNMDIYDPPVHSRVEISVPARDLVIVSINLATFQFYTDCAPCFAENISHRLAQLKPQELSYALGQFDRALRNNNRPIENISFSNGVAQAVITVGGKPSVYRIEQDPRAQLKEPMNRYRYKKEVVRVTEITVVSPERICIKNNETTCFIDTNDAFILAERTAQIVSKMTLDQVSDFNERLIDAWDRFGQIPYVTTKTSWNYAYEGIAYATRQQASFAYCALMGLKKLFFPSQITMACDLALANVTNGWRIITAKEVECTDCVAHAREFECELSQEMSAIDLRREFSAGNLENLYVGLHHDHPQHHAVLDYLLRLKPKDKNFADVDRMLAKTTGGLYILRELSHEGLTEKYGRNLAWYNAMQGRVTQVREHLESYLESLALEFRGMRAMGGEIGDEASKALRAFQAKISEIRYNASCRYSFQVTLSEYHSKIVDALPLADEEL